MQMEVTFRIYAETGEYEDEGSYPVGPAFSTPQEALAYAKTHLSTSFMIPTEQWDGKVVEKDYSHEVHGVYIAAEVEGFPQRDFPWTEWIKAD